MSELMNPDLAQDQDFKTIYKDWQAVRIIRDNYFDGLRLFTTFYSWFLATLAGIGGYILTNRPFGAKDVNLIGWIGIAVIINVLLTSVFMLVYGVKSYSNLTSILVRTGDETFFGGKLINRRAVILNASFPIVGLIASLFAWIYVIFVYYVPR